MANVANATDIVKPKQAPAAFTKALEKLRLANGLSQIQLAQKCPSISSNQLSTFERGSACPSNFQIGQLEAAVEGHLRGVHIGLPKVEGKDEKPAKKKGKGQK
jgi:ribosome-binding protein aMBF1 (putative translation factor)